MTDADIDTWLEVSSSDEAYDSDKIDSDIEAELYSVIHHETDTTTPAHRSDYQEPQVSTAANINLNKSLKKDLIPSVDTNLEKSFEAPEGMKLCSDSSSDELEIIESWSSSKKRKSDVVDNDSEDTQLKYKNGASPKTYNIENSHKKQKTENVNRSANKSVCNRTIEVDSSSDSDSIIYFSADEVNSKLQTNLDGDAVVELSSDSFSSEDSFSPFLANNSFSGRDVNASQPSTSSNTNSNDPWFILSEDLYRSKKPSSRYHERAVQQCTNCKLKGHSAKFCSIPKAVKCYLCGGDHMASLCKDKVCYKCFGKGHNNRFCNQRIVSVCVHCNMKGHSAKNCPDLWRRYHLTTNQSQIIVGNPIAQTSPIYCFSCGAQGHYGAQCQAPRADRFSFPTWTSVISYLHPHETIQKANVIQRNTQLGEVPVWTPNFNQPLPSTYLFPQVQTPLRRQNMPFMAPQGQSPLRRPNTPFMAPQGQTPLLQTPKVKRNKMKKKRDNRKRNKTNDSQQTPESTNKKKSQQDVHFPRTPKQSTPGQSTPKPKSHKQMKKQIKKLLRPEQKQDSSFMTGLYRRLGLTKKNPSFRKIN